MHLIVHIRNINDQRVAISIELTLNRQRVEVLGLVVGNLLTVHRKALSEIAETIEETYCAHVYIRIGSLFHIVAGKHAQATRVNLKGRMNAILHAEISNRRTSIVRSNVHIGTELSTYILDELHECLIFKYFFLALILQALQEHHRIVLHLMIEFWIKVAEQIASLKVPYPPHVMGNLVQALQLLRKT